MTERTLRIGLVGDRRETTPAHVAIPATLALLRDSHRLCAEPLWLATEGLDAGRIEAAELDALWAVPGSPYRSLEGALEGIRYAREQGLPFLGTCGGFQHTLLEFFRNALGESTADHAESNPGAAMPVIDLLACSLVEAVDTVRLVTGSRVAALVGGTETTERFRCRYGFSRPHWPRLDGTALRVTGRDSGGEPRVVELDGHPFFVATLFQPELAARDAGRAHPIVGGLLEAARARHAR